jgi:tetratricopeptide (TPR) repeat protein
METKKEEVIRLLNSKRITEAKELLEEMVISSPEDIFVLYNLGMCYSELGNYQASIETLEKCIEYDPVNSNAYVALGFSYMKASREKDAEEPFLKALEIDPKNIYALQNLGSLYAMEKIMFRSSFRYHTKMKGYPSLGSDINKLGETQFGV